MATTTHPIEVAEALRTNLLFQLAIAQPIALSNHTAWEELTCVGYNPQTAKLEAVVLIKRPTGYSGGLCTTGSPEHVRFWIDWGSGFEHVGLASLARLRTSYGFGIRWFSPLGPLRFEWGFPFKPLPYEESNVFEFTIGNFF